MRWFLHNAPYICIHQLYSSPSRLQRSSCPTSARLTPARLNAGARVVLTGIPHCRQDHQCCSYAPAAGGDQAQEGPSGALMMCVVGGKLAEGINFSDHLGRCGLSLPFRPWALQHCDVMLQRVERHQYQVNRMMTEHVLSVAQSACRSSTGSSHGICVPLPMVVMILAWHQPQERIRLAMLHDACRCAT